MKHIIYSNQDWDAAQNALNAGTLENPYIAAIRWYGGIDIDYNTKEQQSCEDRDLCGDDPTNCHECSCQEQYSDPVDVCECEGGYYWGDECHDEPEPEDPCEGYETQEECECVQQGGEWDGSTCIGLDPCEEYEEGTQELCECQGGEWDGENCNFDDPCGDASPEECECIQQGGTWDGSHGSSEGTCHLPADDPCADAEDPEACECEQQGGTWEGSECVMPSDEQ